MKDRLDSSSDELKKIKKYRILIVLFLIYFVTIIYHSYKSLPDGLNYKSQYFDISPEQVSLLTDVTYNLGNESVREHEIFDEFLSMIDEAEKFIVLDMFMFNDLGSQKGFYPPLSKQMSEALLKKMEENSGLNVWLIVDQMNTSYMSHDAKMIKPLENAGANVVYPSIDELRDVFPLYSGIYRMFFQWFGDGGTGWITNPFGSEEPDISLRSYLKLLNLKGDHRKVLLTDKAAIYASANIHDPSAFHSNTGLKVSGEILTEILYAEKKVLDYTLGHSSGFPTEDDLEIENNESMQMMKVAIFTENAVYHELMDMVRSTEKDDELWMGMYLLSNDSVIGELIEAGKRGVKVKIILDPNQNSFGKDKPGIPNLAVIYSLNTDELDNVEFRWYKISDEQYHTKMIYIRGAESQLFLGSTNITNRSMMGYNLENNIKIMGDNDTQVMLDANEYFNTLWYNRGQVYTEELSVYDDFLDVYRITLFRIQKALRITTF